MPDLCPLSLAPLALAGALAPTPALATAGCAAPPVGPHVKRGSVDDTPCDTTSILKFITERWGLEPLPGVRARGGNLADALQ